MSKQVMRTRVKRFVLPEQIEGPPQLKKGTGIWQAIDLYGNLPKKGQTRREVDAGVKFIGALFSRALQKEGKKK